MISYAVYKAMHLIGILMVFLSLVGVTMHVINGGEKNHGWRKAAALTHGIGLMLTLVGGFGLLARIGITNGGLPVWVLIKLGIWLIFAVITGVIVRKKNWAKSVWFLALILGAIAAYLAGSKPF